MVRPTIALLVAAFSHAAAFTPAPGLQRSIRVLMTDDADVSDPISETEAVDDVADIAEPIAEPAAASAAVAALSFEDALGAQPPLGFFDPLGMLADADQDRFDRLRYVEIKHGRIAQLAFLGQITTRAGAHLPGDIDLSGHHAFDSYPNGLAAIYGPDAIPAVGLAQIVVFVGFLELGVMKDSANGASPGDFVGDFRNGAIDFGWDTFDDEAKLTKRGVELNNGRAAMMGILGLMVHEQLGGSIPLVGKM